MLINESMDLGACGNRAGFVKLEPPSRPATGQCDSVFKMNRCSKGDSIREGVCIHVILMLGERQKGWKKWEREMECGPKVNHPYDRHTNCVPVVYTVT